MRSAIRLALALVLCVVAMASVPAHAQDVLPAWVDVFVERDPATDAARLYFVDAVSGLSTVVQIDNGDDFTLAGGYVLYRKPQSGAIMRAWPDGGIEPHPFIRHTPDLRATRWVTSPDHRSIAWVQVDADGVSHAYTALADGSSLREVPVEQPAPPLEIVPVALTNGMTRFYYDAARSPDAPGNGLYATYLEIHEYNLASATFRLLPTEPNCACGAAFTPDGRLFVRLETALDAGPFNVHVWNARSELGYTIPAPGLPYPFAGDLVVNAAGTIAAYSAASQPPQPEEGETGAQQFAVMFVDLVAQYQVLALPPGEIDYRPIQFTADNSTLLLVNVADGGTYKLSLTNGELTRVSDQTYLGTLPLAS